MGVGGGFLLGSAVAAILNASLTQEAILSWGWRLPFLSGIAVGIVGLYMRLRVTDTPKYMELEVKQGVARAPFIEVIKKHPREIALAFGITLQNTVAFYTALVFMSGYMSSVGKLPKSTASWISTACLTIFILLIPLMGLLSDRIGRKPLLMASCIGYIVLGYFFFAMAGSGEPALAFMAQLLMVGFLAPYTGAGPAFYAEIFPTQVRYTGLSMAYNIAVTIFGGFAPFISTLLIKLTDNPRAPAIYVTLAAAVTLVILWRTRERAFEPLG
jgi:MHS family proline/betaine transporter-like MFS transporter